MNNLSRATQCSINVLVRYCIIYCLDRPFILFLYEYNIYYVVHLDVNVWLRVFDMGLFCVLLCYIYEKWNMYCILYGISIINLLCIWELKIQLLGNSFQINLTNRNYLSVVWRPIWTVLRLRGQTIRVTGLSSSGWGTSRAAYPRSKSTSDRYRPVCHLP